MIDAQTLAARTLAKIAQLEAKRDALTEALKTARKAEVWRLRAALVSTERKLRWQQARAIVGRPHNHLDNNVYVPNPVGRPKKRQDANTGAIQPDGCVSGS